MKKITAGISVVVPVYNSEKSLKELAERLKNVLAQFDTYEIILVDDASCDTSYEVIKEIAHEESCITSIALESNSGQQSAILCGLRHAKLDYTVIIDDDLEQSPEDIIHLYNEIQKGYDVVYGIAEYNSERVRSVGSLMRDLLFKVMTDIPKGIKVSSFRIMNKNTRDAVILADTQFVYISMEILKHTINIANIKTRIGLKAKSNYSFAKLIDLYKKIISTYSKCCLFRGSQKIRQCYKVREIIGGKAK